MPPPRTSSAHYDAVVATHPLMRGAAGLASAYRLPMEPAEGATVLARWLGGPAAVAVKGRVVGVNAYVGEYGGSTWSGDYARLIVNAASFNGGLGSPEPEEPEEPADAGRDGVKDAADNCAAVPNPSQPDVDADGDGDACDSAWFAFVGFARPVQGSGVLNVAKAGSAVPGEVQPRRGPGTSRVRGGLSDAAQSILVRRERRRCAGGRRRGDEERADLRRARRHVHVRLEDGEVVGWTLYLSSGDESARARFLLR